MLGLLVFIAVIIVAAYLCLAVKLGFLVADATETSGFDAGYYLITVLTVLGIPVLIAYEVWA